MTEPLIVALAVLGWLVLALLTATVLAAAGRAGHEEDVRLGYVDDSSHEAHATQWVNMAEGSRQDASS